MLLSDGEIEGLIESDVLVGANPNQIGPISYDLTAQRFHIDGRASDSVELQPGESVMVESVERINLPANLAARVLLRNSRIRQGLTLDAPLYFPGHQTLVYFRVTNMSGKTVELDCLRGIAQLTFERLEKPALKPYSGAFSNEFSYRGLGDYEGPYASQMRELDKKADDVKGIERRIYGNVLALMAIFAAIFTLVNVNASAMGSDATAVHVLVVNFATVGSFALLAGLILQCVRPEGKGAPRVAWVIAVVALVLAVALSLVVY